MILVTPLTILVAPLTTLVTPPTMLVTGAAGEVFATAFPGLKRVKVGTTT
jgi:hypothetical protein